MKYPYLVYRIIPGFYTNTKIHFVKDASLLKNPTGLAIYWEKEIYDESGKITLECREALQLITSEQSRKSKRSVCLVYSADDCNYFDPDGSLLHSEQPPYFKLRLADGDYKTEITTNSDKIDKVNFKKINNILIILFLFSFLFWSGCSISAAKLAKCESEITNSKVNSDKFENTADKNTKPKERKREKKTQKPQKKSKATARCKDGWISYSASRRGTCSHHRGVAKWY